MATKPVPGDPSFFSASFCFFPIISLFNSTHPLHVVLLCNPSSHWSPLQVSIPITCTIVGSPPPLLDTETATPQQRPSHSALPIQNPPFPRHFRSWFWILHSACEISYWTIYPSFQLIPPVLNSIPLRSKSKSESGYLPLLSSSKLNSNPHNFPPSPPRQSYSIP